jgi:heme-degrading monooxygenase HmoA
VVARVTTFRGSPEQIEAGLQIYRESVGPWLREATGFRGFIAFVDREGERGIIMSLWASEELARDSERSGMKLRDEVAQTVETPIEAVEYLSVIELDIPRAPDTTPGAV